MLLITFGMVSVGLTIASLMESLESFGVIQTFVNLPLFFLSGALFPIGNFPKWLSWISVIDPLTYGVDALRSTILQSAWVPIYPLQYDILALIVFDVAMISVGTVIFGRTR
jgi:ABC-2 type transport system permease protein